MIPGFEQNNIHCIRAKTSSSYTSFLGVGIPQNVTLATGASFTIGALHAPSEDIHLRARMAGTSNSKYRGRANLCVFTKIYTGSTKLYTWYARTLSIYESPWRCFFYMEKLYIQYAFIASVQKCSECKSFDVSITTIKHNVVAAHGLQTQKKTIQTACHTRKPPPLQSAPYHVSQHHRRFFTLPPSRARVRASFSPYGLASSIAMNTRHTVYCSQDNKISHALGRADFLQSQRSAHNEKGDSGKIISSRSSQDLIEIFPIYHRDLPIIDASPGGLHSPSPLLREHQLRNSFEGCKGALSHVSREIWRSNPQLGSPQASESRPPTPSSPLAYSSPAPMPPKSMPGMPGIMPESPTCAPGRRLVPSKSFSVRRRGWRSG